MPEVPDPNFKGGTATKPKSTKPKPAAKKSSPAKKAAPKKATSGNTKSASKVSKEGTAVDAFDGKTYPVTSFPTARNNKTGEYVRGNVTRANLPAYREAKKAERAKAKTAADAAKAKAKAEAKAEKEKTAKSKATPPTEAAAS